MKKNLLLPCFIGLCLMIGVGIPFLVLPEKKVDQPKQEVSSQEVVEGVQSNPKALFKQGDCIGEKPAAADNLESWEVVATPEAKYRIEAVGENKYQLRYASGTWGYSLVGLQKDGTIEVLSYTTFEYVDKTYVKTQCDAKVSTIPFGSKADISR